MYRGSSELVTHMSHTGLIISYIFQYIRPYFLVHWYHNLVILLSTKCHLFSLFSRKIILLDTSYNRTSCNSPLYSNNHSKGQDYSVPIFTACIHPQCIAWSHALKHSGTDQTCYLFTY